MSLPMQFPYGTLLAAERAEDDKMAPLKIEPWINPMLPILKVLRVLGRTPFSESKSGRLECHLVSSASAWALLVTAVQLAMVVRVQDAVDPNRWLSFDAVVDDLANVVIVDGVFHSVVATWWATPSIVRAYNGWNNFHVELVAKTERPISPWVLSFCRVGIYASILSVTFVSVVVDTDLTDLYNDVHLIIETVVYFLMGFYFLVLILQWIVFCVVVKLAADVIRDCLNQAVSRSTLDPERLSELRLLWLELRSCTEAFARSVGRIMGLWLLELLYEYTITIYGIVLYVMIDFDISIEMAAITLVYETGCVFVVCYVTSWATDSIHDNVISTMYAVCWTMVSESFYCEMELFLNAIPTEKSYFEILGILTLDKVEFISILETIMTYLVVLVQFNQLSPEVNGTYGGPDYEH